MKSRPSGPTCPAVRPSRNRAEGFTLIELLLALAIAATVAAILYQFFAGLSGSAIDQQERLLTIGNAESALQQITEDGARMYLQDLDGQCGPVLEKTEHATLTTKSISFCASFPSPHDPDPRWAQVVHLRYQLAGEQGDDSRDLELVRTPLAGPEPGSTTLVVRSLSAFRVLFFDGTDWVDHTDEKDRFTPKGLQVHLASEDMENGLHAEVYIPTGSTFSAPETEDRQPTGTPNNAAP